MQGNEIAPGLSGAHWTDSHAFGDDMTRFFDSDNLLYNDMATTNDWEHNTQAGGANYMLSSLDANPPAAAIHQLPFLGVQQAPLKQQPSSDRLFVADAPSGSGGSGHATDDVFDDLGIKPLTDEEGDEEENGVDIEVEPSSLDDNDPDYEHERPQDSPLTSIMSGGSSPGFTSPRQSLHTRKRSLPIETAQTTSPLAKRPHTAATTTTPFISKSTSRHNNKPRGRKPAAGLSDEDEDFKYTASNRKHMHSDGPARTSSRLQNKSSAAPGSRFTRDDDYVLFDEDLEEILAARSARDAAQGNGTGTMMTMSGRGRRSSSTTLNTAAICLSKMPAAPAAVPAGRPGRKPAAAHASNSAKADAKYHYPAGTAAAGNASRSGRRTAPPAAAPQRIRATSARHELKGRPSFAEIVHAGFMRPGQHKFAVGNVEVSAAIGEDGAITYLENRYRAISKFALVVLRERNPSRQSCDGWKEVAWNGEKLDVLRVKVHQHVRQQARSQKVAAAAGGAG